MEGCAHVAVPETDDSQAAIGFIPGAMLLNDDAGTKAAVFKEGDFQNDDIIAVFGRHHGINDPTDIFVNTPVQNKGEDYWVYSPLKHWNWLSEGDYYDFLSVYPSGKGTARMDIPGNLAILTHYDLSDSDNNNYDLMYALYRRHYSRVDEPVPLNFHHTLSAVRVVFENDSNNQDITVNSYEFTHMVISADAKATMDGIGNPEVTWIDAIHSADAIRQVTPGALLKGKKYSGEHSYTGPFDFFIPTALDATSDGSADESKMPHLHISYTSGQTQQEADILLKSISRNPLNGDHTPVEVWEPGVRYTYNINIRMDGGVQIIVVTTEWDNIYAETPGVMID